MILDLYILHRFHRLPGGVEIGDLHHSQKRFLIMAESLLGRNFEGILERARAIQRLETLESLRTSGRIEDILPAGMAETLRAAGLDPALEARERLEKELERLRSGF